MSTMFVAKSVQYEYANIEVLVQHFEQPQINIWGYPEYTGKKTIKVEYGKEVIYFRNVHSFTNFVSFLEYEFGIIGNKIGTRPDLISKEVSVPDDANFVNCDWFC